MSEVSEITGKNFIVDPRVKGNITVISSKPLTADAVYELFLGVLSVNGFAEIEKDIKRLALLGRDGNLSMQDMEGGTFTITNGGVFGSLMSTPIINQPQSAILGMHKIQDRPMAINGKVEIRPMMYLALSYDHRIVDGKESVGFLVSVKDYLENPEKMLVGVDPVKALLEL